MERFIATMDAHENANARRVYYLSLEYLMGRMLNNNLYNAGLFDATRQALAELGHDLPTLGEDERDMGLGNGGLGRLAACFLDSLATLDFPAIGYGIFYEEFTGEEGMGAPREIIPRTGDMFTVLEQWMDLDERGDGVEDVTQEGGTLTFGDQMFQWRELDAAAGSYIVGFIVEDLDGETYEVYTQVEVE